MGKLNIEKMRSKLSAESSKNADFDKLGDGKNVRRVLFPKGTSDTFFSEGYLHFGLGADGKTMVTCPKTWGKHERCPICEYVEQLKKSKDKDEQQLAKDISARRRIYINVINRDDDSEEPKVLAIGATVLKGILDTVCDADYADVTDYSEGRDVTITKKGQGLKTEYSVLPKPKVTVASETYSEEELDEKMTDLESLFVRKSYEELEDILNGVESSNEEDDEEEEDDPKPKTAKKAQQAVEEEESVGSYSVLELDELVALCNERKITLPNKISKERLVMMLEMWDEDHEEETETVGAVELASAVDKEEKEQATKAPSDIKSSILDALKKRTQREEDF